MSRESQKEKVNLFNCENTTRCMSELQQRETPAGRSST